MRSELNQEQILYAVGYERVSTDHDEQKESMVNQQQLRESYLRRHTNIYCKEVFSEVISGKTDERPEYSRMLEYISEHDEISYILVKDTKRLFRSTEVAARFKNFAKAHDVQLILLGTGEIYDVNAEDRRLLYSIDAVINEEYVIKQSEYGRISHRQKMEAKRLNRNNVTYGYSWDAVKKEIVIDSEQAAVVRTIFEKYVFQGLGVREIQRYLDAEGVPRSTTTISKYLSDTSYIGIFCMNKKGSELGVGVGQHTVRYNTPKDEWVRVEVPQLAIVDRELFDLAQKIRTSRQTTYTKMDKSYTRENFRGTHLFSSKVFCKCCGQAYHFDYSNRAKTIGIYRETAPTVKQRVNGKCTNPVKRVHEEELCIITKSIINDILSDNVEIFDKLIPILQKVFESGSSPDQQRMEKLVQEKKRLEKMMKKMRAKIIEMDGPLKEDLQVDYNGYHERMAQIQDEMKTIMDEQTTKGNTVERLNEIRKFLNNLKCSGWKVVTITRKIVDMFIERIVVGPNGLEFIMHDKFVHTFYKDSEKQAIEPASSLVVDMKRKMTDYKKMAMKHGRTDNLIPLQTYEFTMKDKENKRNSVRNVVIELKMHQ